MDESGNHYSQQTDTRTENQILHVLTHRQVLNNENTWTQQGVGSWGEIAWGEMPDIGEEEEGSKSHCHVCTYATI